MMILLILMLMVFNDDVDFHLNLWHRVSSLSVASCEESIARFHLIIKKIVMAALMKINK